MRTEALILLTAAAAMCLTGGCRIGPFADHQAAIDHYVQGRLLAEGGDLDAALAELASAVKANPDLSIAHAAAGDIHRKRGDWKLAQRSYEMSCQANPYAFRPHYNLGLTYQTLANAVHAAKRVQQYLRLAVQVYLRANTIDSEDFETNLNLSACYFRLGKYELAEQFCKAAIALRSDDPHAHSNLGIIYDSQNRLYDAIKEYKASLEIDTHQPKLLLNLGTTYMRQNRLKAAIRAFELASREAPDDPAPWEQIGSCHYRLGEYDKALDAYQNAIVRVETSPVAHRGMGVVYMTQFVLDKSKTEFRDKALAAWHISLEVQPDQEDLHALVRKYAPTYTGPRL